MQQWQPGLRFACPACEAGRGANHEPASIHAPRRSTAEAAAQGRGSDGGADRTEARVQQLTAERDAARAQLTDLRLREAVARTRAEALQTEVERLKGLLEAGLLKHVWRFCCDASVGTAR